MRIVSSIGLSALVLVAACERGEKKGDPVTAEPSAKPIARNTTEPSIPIRSTLNMFPIK